MFEPTESYDKLVDNLFDKLWLCQADKECFAMLRNPPKEINLTTRQVQEFGHIDQPRIQRIESNPNMDGIIEMLANSPRSTQDMEERPEMNLIRPDKGQLSTSNIAEILFRGGSLTILDPINTVEIHRDIQCYLDALDQKRAYEPHFHSPPEEDLQAFKKLRNMLESMAHMYAHTGTGNSALAMLMNIARETTHVVKEGDQQVVNLNGFNDVGAIGYSTPEGNVYDF